MAEEEGGRLFGEVIMSAHKYPQLLEVIKGDKQAHEFLRLLHGENKDIDGGDDVWWRADSAGVTACLQLW